ncbi:TIGR03364 family FAD-dependent oxidoreductase [Salininema proteolyticum]|uniref:TIGR03364 family FAD-dependent oxidoreductase n=1 Tax=Salininema proteolyticum TaxID=1607685 RepID=A0ABV8U0U6_9ACTN
MDIIIVGGGVVGTLQAWEAIDHGHNVVQIEREPEARGASVRNFGLVWTSGRDKGAESRAATRSRELWEKISLLVDGVGFRNCGSMTLARTDAEVAVAEAAAKDDEVGERFTVLEPDEVRKVNPLLQGDFKAGLWCPGDAAVESRQALPALRAHMGATGRYRWLKGREVRDAGTGWVRDDQGRRHEGDQVLLCTGAWHSGLVREMAGEIPVRRVRLQMMQTAPLMEKVSTAVANADSFRYYPAYRSPELEELVESEPQSDTAAAHRMQLLAVQRLDGSLTIGDTHEYEEPFGFDVTEDAYDELRREIESLFGRELPPTRRRWAGVYSQLADPDGEELLLRKEVVDGVWLLTGPGGRGLTMAPYFAHQSSLDLNW